MTPKDKRELWTLCRFESCAILVEIVSSLIDLENEASALNLHRQMVMFGFTNPKHDSQSQNTEPYFNETGARFYEFYKWRQEAKQATHRRMT